MHFNVRLFLDLYEKCGIQGTTPVSVVAFIGLTNGGITSNVSSIANAIIEKAVFGQPICCDKNCNCRPNGATLLIDNGNKCGLWIYCDPTKNSVYLLLDSINDSDALLNLWEESQSTIENELAQPISKLDSNLISLLKTISSVKRHIMPHANNFMNSCWQHLDIPPPYGSISSTSGYSGRSGSVQGGVIAPGRYGNKSESSHDKVASGSIKRIKEALQARIRFLFRTCHLVQTSDVHAPFDNRQLFILPPPSSQFFVHLIPRGSTGNLLSPNPARKMDQRGADNFEIKLLKDFVHNWIKWATTGRISVKRGVTPSELPNIKQWISGSVALKELLFGNIGKEILERKNYSNVEDTLNRRLKDYIQINNRFSASHCSQSSRKAIDIYLLESPTYYSKQYHDVKLKGECYNIWEHGRQRCDKRSLSGHECVLGVTLHACNCGKSRSEREDPFDLNDANVDFFQFLNCCDAEGNQCLVPPFFKHKTKNTSMWSLIRLGSGSLYRSNSGLDKWEGFITNTNFLLPLDISLVTNIKKVQDEMTKNEWTIDLASGDKKKTRAKSFKQKGKSGEEPKSDISILLGNDIIQQWLTPSSFSLNDSLQMIREVQQIPIQIDESTVTSDNKSYRSGDINKERRNRRGIKNSLKKEREKIADNATPILKDSNELQKLKGYLGVEYECPIGHRFMSCGKGQVCKLGHAGHIKETANNLLEQDLPIYIHCPCSNSTNNPPTLAQLQRIIIVTPDSPILITLNPIIKDQTNENANLSPMDNFQKDNQYFKGITLPKNSLIVLRLPYVHYDRDGEPIRPDKVINHTSITSTLYLKKKFLFIEMPKSENDDFPN
ncbi:1318_t:CDS:10 [Diversispora eburnea]|uniref:Nonsense-mediated mRNA decay factor SMG8 n=1 Tax=Diversispora eburnea TaxID=1213867 RepID=A0A9N8YRD3_9GLOM|nr:1318_t:CDS:10 [Diversispora eburnea]